MYDVLKKACIKNLPVSKTTEIFINSAQKTKIDFNAVYPNEIYFDKAIVLQPYCCEWIITDIPIDTDMFVLSQKFKMCGIFVFIRDSLREEVMKYPTIDERNLKCIEYS